MAAWAPNLLLAAPFFLSPRGGTVGDALGVAIAILVFTAAAWPAPQLGGDLERWHRFGRRRGLLSHPPVLLMLGALAGGLALSAAVATLVMLFGLLELARLAIATEPASGSPSRQPATCCGWRPGLPCSGSSWRRRCGWQCCCSAFPALRLSSPWQRGARQSLDRDFVLLTLLVGTVVLYRPP